MLRATHLRLSCLSFSMNLSAKGTRTSGESFSSALAASFPRGSAPVRVSNTMWRQRTERHQSLETRGRKKGSQYIIWGVDLVLKLLLVLSPNAIAQDPFSILGRMILFMPTKKNRFYARRSRRKIPSTILILDILSISACLAKTHTAHTCMKPRRNQPKQAEQRHRRTVAAAVHVCAGCIWLFSFT